MLPFRYRHRSLALLLLLSLWAVLSLWVVAAGDSRLRAESASANAAYVVPSFWDPVYRQERPNLSGRPTVRFLTEAQDPPFSFIGADGLPTGFHVELVRAICEELEIACTIQPLRWDLLVEGLDRDQGDAIIAALRIDEESRARYRFSRQFLTRPARFAARRDADRLDITPQALSDRTVAVLAETAHEAYLRAFFGDVGIRPFDDANAAREALMEGEVYALFGDGLTLSLWLNGAASRRCCEFRGGPYTESRYFGEGFAVAVAPSDEELGRAVDYALSRIHADGTYAEIFQRYFPISFY